MTANDTYFYLLEQPAQREYELVGSPICYQSKRFDRSVYEQARGRNFESLDSSYLDWLSHGRRLGLQYNRSSNTVLKIILKAKDELELIDKWYQHHAAIVGPENIIILDCGSTDNEYISRLDEYSKYSIVLKYPKHYNDIHHPPSNKSLFELICSNCRYISVLDADEFLFAMRDGALSSFNVIPALESATESGYTGTWLNTQTPIMCRNGKLDWNSNVEITLDREQIIQGTIAGKSILSSSVAMRVEHLGHNMHTQDVVSLFTKSSFGVFFIIHARTLDPAIVEKRTIKHLRTKGVLPPEVSTAESIVQFLTQLKLAGTEIRPDAAKYVEHYLNRFAVKNSEIYASTSLLSGAEFEILPILNQTLATIDFEGLILSLLEELRNN